MAGTIVADKVERHIELVTWRRLKLLATGATVWQLGGAQLWLRSDHFLQQAQPFCLLLINNRSTICPPLLTSTTTPGYFLLCLRMRIWKRGTANSKDDGASRRPTRRRTSFWTRAQKEIIRGRVPAYRLREDALRDYLGRIFPKQENFHIQVSWHQRSCQHAKWLIAELASGGQLLFWNPGSINWSTLPCPILTMTANLCIGANESDSWLERRFLNQVVGKSARHGVLRTLSMESRVPGVLRTYA
jgi:hypothetical protein